MPRGYTRTGTQVFLLNNTGATGTGAGSWHDLQGAYTKFSMQCVKKTAGTTAYTVLLQGTLTTASTTPKQLISYTLASDTVTVKFSTGTIPPVTKIRYNVTAIGGTSASSGFGVRIFAACAT